MTALFISNVALWIAVLVLVLVVLVLARQVGILYERIAPVGALTLDNGPAVGDAAPRFELNDLLGNRRRIGFPGTRSQLLFFLSPTCPVCKKLLPILKAVARREAGSVNVLLASDGEMPEHLVFYHKARLEAFPYLLSAELGMRFQISRLPYAVLMDPQGIVRAKGLVNSREQIESLFTAQEIGVASAQEWLERMDRRTQANAARSEEAPDALVR